MPAKPITYQMLEAKGACQGQVILFKEAFPNGAPLTIEAALSVADKFDWDWAARKLLSEKGLKAYSEAEAPAWKAYEEAEALARKAYEEAGALARKAYEEAEALARKAYKEAETLARKAYKEATALAFATAYLNDRAS